METAWQMAEPPTNGVQLNTALMVAPGVIETEMSQQVRDRAGDEVKSRILLRRYADHVVRLAHPEAEVDIDYPEDLLNLPSSDTPLVAPEN